MSKRDDLCAEIKRLKKAREMTSSKYLKKDYDKAIKKKSRDLAIYDFYMKGGN